MSDIQPTPQPAPRRAPKWTGWAVTLFAIGLLILIPSGLCTGIMGVGALYEGLSGNGSDATGFFTEVLAFGGPFIAVGIGLVMAGLSIRKRG